VANRRRTSRLRRPLTLWDGTGDDAVAYYYNATTQATQWEKPGGVDFDSAAVTKPQASAGAPEYPEYPEYPVYPVRCRVGFGRLPRVPAATRCRQSGRYNISLRSIRLQ